MKRFAMICAMAMVALALNLSTTSVSARPQYKTRFDDMMKDSKAIELIKQHKCNVCHHTSDKKKRNDFGSAINKYMDKATFDELKSNKAKLDMKIEEAIKAALKEKSPKGKTFGELIDAGELPAEIVK